VANGGDIGGAGTLIDSGTNQGGQGGGTGREMGRKVKLTPQQVAHAKKLIEQGEHHNTVAKSLGVSRRTIYRRLNFVT
jgi:DNA invertase Pin-like site-specific DNA recombinase